MNVSTLVELFDVLRTSNNEGQRPVRDPRGVSTLVEFFDVLRTSNNEGQRPELFDNSIIHNIVRNIMI